MGIWFTAGGAEESLPIDQLDWHFTVLSIDSSHTELLNY